MPRCPLLKGDIVTLRTYFFVLCSLGLALRGGAVYAQLIRIEGPGAGLTIGQAAAAEYGRAHPKVRVTVGLSGSGGALRKLCRGDVDLAHSARPMLKAELEACTKANVQFVELPLAFDAVAVVVNAKNSFVKSLTLPELRTMWQDSAQGKVVRWNQVNPAFPEAPLKLLAPDAQFDGSNYFLAAVLKPEQSARRDTMSSVDDNVLIQGLVRDLNTVSYLPLATYLEHRDRLRAVAIAANAAAQPVLPSTDAITSGQYQPLSRPLFLYVNAQSLARAEVAAFAAFYAANAGRLAREADYVPLSESTYRAGQTRLRQRTTGSVWNGAIPVGASLQEFQKREAL
jgi:phosphate transport system substrate-binding protein